MNKYVPLEAVLNFIPKNLVDNYPNDDLLSYAFQGIRQNVRYDKLRHDYGVALIEIKNNKANLPKDVIKIDYASYSKEEPNIYSIPEGYIIKEYETENGCKAILYQTPVFNQVFKELSPIKYVGQDSSLVTSDYVKNYNPDCNIGFSIDKAMSCITIDQQTGYLVIVYLKLAADSNGNLIVPDDANLLRAAALYAEAEIASMKTWDNPQFDKLRQQRLMESAMKFREFDANYKLDKLNPELHEEFIFNRFNKLQSHPTISGNNRNFRF